MKALLIDFRLGLRELRGGLSGFRVFLACLALGVAAIAGIGSLSTSIVSNLRAQGQVLLGGDVEVRLTQREATADEQAFLGRLGTLSTLQQLRGILYATTNDRRSLVEIKAVDQLYPHYGEIGVDPAEPLSTLLQPVGNLPAVIVEPRLLTRLDIAVGAEVKIGDGIFVIAGTITREPDVGSDALALGPHIIMRRSDLAATGLLQTGSQVYWTYRLKLQAEEKPGPVVRAIKKQFPTAGWRLRDARNGAPALRQWIDRIGLFLTLIGLAALLIGGVGVGNAVKNHLDGKRATIATLKCLGATGGRIFRIYLTQVMILAVGGILLGLVIGALAPFAGVLLFSERLPIAPDIRLYPAPLAAAALYGLLTALTFAIWPLARARDISAGGLFRDLVAPHRRWPRPGYLTLLLISLASLAGLAVAIAEDRRLALWFIGGTAASFLLIALCAAALVYLARLIKTVRWRALRFAIANLHRPGAPTVSIMLSLGLGLTLLVTVILIQGNLVRQIADRLPDEAPAFFFIDIQPNQLASFSALVRSVDGAHNLREVANLRGRIVRINDTPAEQARIGSDSQWVVRGDRNLTFSPTLPEGSLVAAGDWWPADYRGPPLISLDDKIAADMRIGVGDRLTLNILGREIEAKIANLRRIDWNSLGINFAIVFAPGTLEAAPHSYIATVDASGAAEENLFRAVTDRFSNISAIRMKEALSAVNDLLATIGRAAQAGAGITLLAGVLVLAGAMAGGQRRRIYDAVLLKVLGATRRDILIVYMIEYLLLGLLAALLASGLGWLAAYEIVTGVMKAPWTHFPGAMTVTVVGSALTTLLLGLIGAWRALTASPMSVLRDL